MRGILAVLVILALAALFVAVVGHRAGTW